MGRAQATLVELPSRGSGAQRAHPHPDGAFSRGNAIQGWHCFDAAQSDGLSDPERSASPRGVAPPVAPRPHHADPLRAVPDAHPAKCPCIQPRAYPPRLRGAGFGVRAAGTFVLPDVGPGDFVCSSLFVSSRCARFLTANARTTAARIGLGRGKGVTTSCEPRTLPRSRECGHATGSLSW